MADIEVKASPSPGATGPPTPSPSAAPASPWPNVRMRVNHVQPLPTPSSVYRAVANLNRGFEEDTRNLKALQEFNIFPEKIVIAWCNVLHRLQAEASLRLIDTIHDRLMNNALYYDRLCWTREKQLEDPNDVLLKAEERKREIAQEEQRRDEQSDEGST